MNTNADLTIRTPTAPGSSRRITAGIVLASVLTASGFAALLIDVPVARGCCDKKDDPQAAFHVPGDVRDAINLAETFGHGAGVAVILLVVILLDRDRRRVWLRILACSAGAGLTADALKMLVIARVRPHSFDFQGGVFATFGQWMPLWEFGSKWQSVPSAHAATAAGLAMALSWRYPRGRWLFASLAVATVCQRVVSSAHFVSDTLWGAALGVLIATLFLYVPWPSRLLDRFERTAC